MMHSGTLAIEYARRNGWNLRKRNIMVEGDSDVRFFSLANKFYEQETGRNLLGDDISVFSCGSGEAGGTYGMFEKLPPLFSIIKSDPDVNGNLLFRVIALIDDDYNGRGLLKALTSQYRDIKLCQHLFILKRIFPRTTSETNALRSQIEKHNVEWKGIDSEIEDLLGKSLIDLFLETEHNPLKKTPQSINGRSHYEWTDGAKGRIFTFAEQNADIAEFYNIIEVLKSLRFYLGLDPDGL